MRTNTLPTMTDREGNPVLHPLAGEPITAIAWKQNGQPLWPVMGGSGPLPGGGQPPATPPATGTPLATPPATGTPTPTGTPPAQGATPPPADPPLGEAGQRALAAERQFRADAETARKAAEDELAALKAATQTDQEKAVEAARTEGLTAGNQRLIRAEIKAAAATAGFHDPKDAAVQLNEQIAKISVTKDGDVDDAKVKALIAELATAKPYLLKAPGATPPAPLPGQGNHPPAPKSGREAGRAEAERRFGKKTTQS